MSSRATAARFAMTEPRSRHATRVERAGAATASSTVVLFAVALLASASLSFVLEPLFARMVLPLFGGAPAVWNTCVVFYQLVLLAGYLYAHAVSRWLPLRAQVVAQLALMLGALLVLPIAPAINWMPHASAAVVPGILLMLVVSIGLPFFAVSTIAPLLQQWFSRTGHKDAADPYFLYAASNLGSFAGLLAYPIVIEPNLRVSTQSQLWVGGYVALIALVALAGLRVWKQQPDGNTVASSPSEPAAVSSGIAVVVPAGFSRSVYAERLRWLVLSAVPASLMLSVTTYASTDIAAVPLLWIVPLALYLLTFVFAFAQRQVLPGWLAGGLLPLLALPCAFAMVTESTRPLGLVLPLHVATFFVAALSCHSQLSQSRPDASRLTEFYLWIALGGVVGGLFNVLVAPLIFTETFEYPLALLLACLLRPTPRVGTLSVGSWLLDFPIASVPGLALVALIFSARFSALAPTLGSRVLVVSLPLFICLGLWPWPRRFALGLLGIFIAAPYGIAGEPVLHAERGFFGEHQVIERAGKHVLMHGTTNHGAQWIDPARRFEPTTYYGRTGPIGQVLGEVRRADAASIGIVGLGTAGLAAYARPTEAWTFYELNPAVERIARDRRLFTMLARAGLNERVVLGDARLALGRTTERYNLLIVDAFSSDAIPVHLITREAVALYLQRLAPGGALVFHISNRYLDLRSVLANLATAEGLVAFSSAYVLTDRDRADGLLESTWVALARSDSDLGPLSNDGRWQRLRGEASAAWTDDFSNIWSVFHW